MKRLFFLIQFFLLLLACNNNDNTIIIHQKVGIGNKLYLSVSDNQGGFILIDSQEVKNNIEPVRFRINGDTSKMYSLSSDFNNYKIDFIKDLQVIEVYADFFKRSGSVKNSPATASLLKFNTNQSQLIKKISDLENQKHYSKSLDSLKSLLNGNFINYADTVSNPTAFMLVYNQADFGKNYELLSGFIKKADSKFSNYQPFVILHKKVQNYLNIMTQELHVGDRFPNFILTTEHDSTAVLTNVKKYRFIDFWATWNIKSLNYTKVKKTAFEKFPDNKFEIISIALEPDKQVWQTYLTQNNIHWKNLIDMDMWDGRAINTVKFDSIPSNYLLDQNGKILMKSIAPDSIVSVISHFIK